MKKISVGMIGAGWAARHRHIEPLSTLSQVRFSHIWSRDITKARQLAADFHFEHVAENWEEVVTAPAVDAVIVAAPPVMHCAASLAVLKAGKHLLCQARMARNLQEAQAMARAASESDAVVALYPALPGLKGDRVMQRLLHEEKFIGEVRDVRLTGIAGPKTSAEYRWTADPDVAGINAMSLGLWTEVANRWLGTAESVMAIARNYEESSLAEQLQTRMPESLAVAAQLRSGAVASYHFSDGTGAQANHRIEIFGTEGSVAYVFFKEEIFATRKGEELQSVPIPAAEQRSQDTDLQFIRAIEGAQDAVYPTFEEGLRYMEFCEAVAISCFTGNKVPMPPRPTMESWGKLLSGNSSVMQ